MINSNKGVFIIGAGIAGLSAAFDLSKRNIPVTIIEKNDRPGGLASSISLNKEYIDRFYHFLCKSDIELIKLIERLELTDKLHWIISKTSYFQNNTIYSFTTPLDLVRFNIVPLLQRIRFGINVIQCRYLNNWRELDHQTAQNWLKQKTGNEAYSIIWEPLLKIKFGKYYEQISAAWIWHRINRISRSRPRLWEKEKLGFLKGSTKILCEKIMKELQQSGVKIAFNTNVEKLIIQHNRITGIKTSKSSEIINCKYCYSTIPPPSVLKLINDQPKLLSNRYFKRLANINYIGIVCLILHLRKPITDSFWININSLEIPFNGIIEYTNLNKSFDSGKSHVLYIPFYMSKDDSRFTLPNEELLKICINSLKQICNTFSSDWIIDYKIFREEYAQPIPTTNFSKYVPSIRTPIKGLYISDACQLYPEDRTLSGMIRKSSQVSEILRNELERNFR